MKALYDKMLWHDNPATLIVSCYLPENELKNSDENMI